MTIQVSIDETVLDRAIDLGHHKSKDEAIAVALQEYVRREGQRKLLELEGTIDFDPAYDYKAERRRDNCES